MALREGMEWHLVDIAPGAEGQGIPHVLGALVRDAAVAAVERPLRVIRLDEVLQNSKRKRTSCVSNHDLFRRESSQVEYT